MDGVERWLQSLRCLSDVFLLFLVEFSLVMRAFEELWCVWWLFPQRIQYNTNNVTLKLEIKGHKVIINKLNFIGHLGRTRHLYKEMQLK